MQDARGAAPYNAVMFDHIGLRVRDLAASVRLYKAMLEPLGYVIDDSGTGFGPKGEPALWLVAGTGAAHVALRATSRKAVDGFHAAALAAGAKDNGKPGLRKDYSPTYYAAFVTDPDGNNVEAVTFAE